MRRHHHTEFPPARLAAERDCSIAVCIPARDEASTIGAMVDDLATLVELGAIDRVAVVDHDSGDGTAATAEARGAEVYAASAIAPEAGPVEGKGDVLWRALQVLDTEVVCFLDADLRGPAGRYAAALAGAVACEDVPFVKGAFDRVGRDADAAQGAGRVTQLTARPLLRLLYPELAKFREPLGGQVAAKADLLRSFSFPPGYGVDVALLIDAYRALGLDGLAEVDLGELAHQPRGWRELAQTANEVALAIVARAPAGWDAAGPASGERRPPAVVR